MKKNDTIRRRMEALREAANHHGPFYGTILCKKHRIDNGFFSHGVALGYFRTTWRGGTAATVWDTERPASERDLRIIATRIHERQKKAFNEWESKNRQGRKRLPTPPAKRGPKPRVPAIAVKIEPVVKPIQVTEAIAKPAKVRAAKKVGLIRRFINWIY